MAEVIQRIWRSGPRKVKRSAWGYTAQIDGQQVRKYDAAWSKQDAEEALAARLLERDTPPPPTPMVPKTFGEVAADYLTFKNAEGKRSVDDDERALTRLRAWFGDETPVGEITAQRIADYSRARAEQLSRLKRPVSPATRNRELACLRHLLRLAAEWGHTEKAPRIRLAKEPEHRVRWLEPNEETALLVACTESRTAYLVDVVRVALETGMRRREITEFQWPQVGLTRGVLRLEHTKSGRRREVPMRQEVYAIFAAMPEPRLGRVWPDRHIRKAFENAVERAGLADFRFHDCRHHFASWFMMRGGDLLALQKILGHRTLTMTQKYAHLSPDYLRSAMDRTARQPALNPEAISTTSAQRDRIEAARAVSP
jgi:site-specific recombinase XerD